MRDLSLLNELELKIREMVSALEREKSWLESQVKAWMQTAQKYYHKIKESGNCL